MIALVIASTFFYISSLHSISETQNLHYIAEKAHAQSEFKSSLLFNNSETLEKLTKLSWPQFFYLQCRHKKLSHRVIRKYVNLLAQGLFWINISPQPHVNLAENSNNRSLNIELCQYSIIMHKQLLNCFKLYDYSFSLLIYNIYSS